MELTQSMVETFVGNPSTLANGRKLTKNMENCRITDDKSLIFGEVKGSGKNPYRCSVDMINPAAPVARCSCPSRQIPCKHAAGLMLYYLSDSNKFDVGEVPEDVASKRTKIEKRVENKEKKKEKAVIDLSATPSKSKIVSAKKRISTQLDGLKVAESLVQSIVCTGLGSVDSNMLGTLKNQLNELGNYYINGIKEVMTQLLIYIKSDDSDFTQSIQQLLYINALLKKSRTHLESKLNSENPTSLVVDSEIEQQIGHIWKLDELQAYGCFENNAELIQLVFFSYADEARREFVDESYLLSLKSAVVYKKLNYRPYKAVKYVKADDTVREVIVTDVLYKYPGGLNPRCRWDENTFRTLNESDCSAIAGLAVKDFAAHAKTVKSQLKSPLSDRNPVALLAVAAVEGNCVVDIQGNKQILSDSENTLFREISPKLLRNTAILVMYNADLERGTLTAEPLSIVHKSGIILLR
ncbi:MAG: SWIM zinc finger domain-containing protein [Oscillospiraceae bacterium]|nr:SWIM zinc finger domain-containing protein [Oscillospiraceae bacterium]